MRTSKQDREPDDRRQMLSSEDDGPYGAGEIKNCATDKNGR